MKLLGLFLACLCGVTVLCAQDKPEAPPAGLSQAPAQAEASDEESAQEPAYVRRISLGVTGSAPFLLLLRGGETTTITTTPPVERQFKTNPKKHFTGGGVMLQFALFDRWALNVNGIQRTAEYESFRITYTGVNNPNTAIDERTQTGITEKTKARYFDFPILVRRFNKGRYEYKHRWFFEAGPSLRYVSKIRTSNEYDAKGERTTDAIPAGHKKQILGATAGFGGILIDPVGVRITPEVRYTRWFGATFDAPPTRSRRDQVEFLISIGF